MKGVLSAELPPVIHEMIQRLETTDEAAPIESSTVLPWVVHVDDDADFSNAIKKRLEALGVVVVRAFDGMDGLECIAKYPPNAIILDLDMPNGTGDEILLALRENPSTQDIPVLILTCNHGRQMKRRLKNLGAAAYLTKPLDFQSLHEHLGNYIDVLPISRTDCPTNTDHEEVL